MVKHHKPRAGSLQFWPRKRASRLVPRVNWKPLESLSRDIGFLGFLGYKVGITSFVAKDLTEHSMTKGKKIVIPVTAVECPPMKILSVRFYKNGKVISELIVDNDKELKRKIKQPKSKVADIIKKIDELKKESDNVKAILYSIVKRTGIKKKPDLFEVGIGGNLDEKIDYIKKFIGKEINVNDVLKENILVDVRGLTKGKGFQGPVKRFGISKKQSKSEKGVRRPGNIGPWTPKKVSFRAPMAGQLGYFTRVQYNNKIVGVGNASSLATSANNWHKYGSVKTSYVLLKGSIQGAQKRPILLTQALRPTKKTEKIKVELIEMVK